MRVLCVYIEHFAAAVEGKEHQELEAQPIVIGGLAHERKPVFDCSHEAAQFGIKRGLPLREAYHLCPDAIFLPPDETKYVQAFDEVLDVLERFSPVVEAEVLGKAFLEISGFEGLFSSEEELAREVSFQVSSKTSLSPAIGIGANKFASGTAASLASPGKPVVVEKGKEKEFLKPLPVALLPVSEEMKRRLSLLGLCTIGEVASLPRDALVAQFRQEGLVAHELANGMDERLLVPRVKPAVLEEELCCDTPIVTIEGLEAGLSELLDRLTPRLKERNQVCRQARLRLSFDDGSSAFRVINLKGATDSKSEILGILRWQLEGERFHGGIMDIGLVLTGLGGEKGEQNPLLLMENKERSERIRCAAAGLKLRFGINPLKKLALLDPSSRIPERRATLIDFELEGERNHECIS